MTYVDLAWLAEALSEAALVASDDEWSETALLLRDRLPADLASGVTLDLLRTLARAHAVILAEGMTVLVDAELVTWTEEFIVARSADGSERVVSSGVSWAGRRGELVGVARGAV